MNWARAEFMEFQKVQFGSVTFVLTKAILRKLTAKVTHHPVARNLRNHACGGNAHANAVALDNRGLRKRKWNHRQTIDQNVVRRLHQHFDRKVHSPMARTQNVDPVDLYRIDDADSPSHFRIRDKLAINFLPQFSRELFGIVQTPMTKFFRENYCGCDDRTG